LLVHHAGKGGAQRGSSKKEDILDLSIELRRPATYEPEQGAAFAVEFKKARHLTGKDAESFEASLTVNEKGAACWAMTALTESTYARVVELAGLGMNQRDIAEELKINKSNVSRHWRKAVEAGEITPRGPHDHA
jgi:DNA-directed RNA polymerase specialized sigma24 family protein